MTSKTNIIWCKEFYYSRLPQIFRVNMGEWPEKARNWSENRLRLIRDWQEQSLQTRTMQYIYICIYVCARVCVCVLLMATPIFLCVCVCVCVCIAYGNPSILVWEISWTEEPDGLQSMGLQRVTHNLVTKQTTKNGGVKLLREQRHS